MQMACTGVAAIVIWALRFQEQWAFRLSGVWRTAFGLGIIPLCFIIFWRAFKLQESAVWAANREGRERKRQTRLLFHHFWHRCSGPAAAACYIFQSLREM